MGRGDQWDIPGPRMQNEASIWVSGDAYPHRQNRRRDKAVRHLNLRSTSLIVQSAMWMKDG